MLTTVQGRYHDGVIQLDEIPPDLTDARVIVTFLGERPAAAKPKRPIGLASDHGQSLPAEFDAPLPEELAAAFRGEGA